jgi:hypothetical protein
MYTYAFLRNPTASLDLPPGIIDSVEIVRCMDLAAIVEPDFSMETLQERDDLLVQAVLSHDLALRQLFLQTTLLPLRFGTQFASRQTLLDHLQAQQQNYLQQLAQLDGKAEYMLKFLPLEVVEISIPSSTKGRDYFLAKKSQHQQRLEHQNQQQQQLNIVVRGISATYPTVLSQSNSTGAETLYLLALRQDETALSQQVQIWQRTCSLWELRLEEALPPYHFV